MTRTPRRYLSRPEVAARIGVKPDTLNRYKLRSLMDRWRDPASAKQYGLTVEQYKTNNVLRVPVTSADVAELAAAMCSPLFAKTTGSQVPVDGGNERVI